MDEAKGEFMEWRPVERVLPKWQADPPETAYAEDAHAIEYGRSLPQFDARRFARRVMGMLP